MKSLRLNIIFGLLLSSLAVIPADAQNARGTILGNVQDASGAAASGAPVALRNVDTNVTQTFITPNSGDYIFVNLIPGTYEVRVEVKGFKVAVAGGLVVQVDHTLRQDFTLEVGAVTQSVVVSATSQMLQTDNATIGQVVNDRFIADLPLSGRDFTSLIQLNAGVSQPAGGIQNSTLDIHGLNDNFSEFSVNGARASSNSYLIDGIVDNNILWGTVTASPSIDAIQEFKLQNGLYSAAYGSGSAQINVAIKSGTNRYHGTAYDFIQNAAFQPEDKINAALNNLNGTNLPLKQKLVQNQFGIAVGGPIRIPRVYNGNDRSFFFLAYEGGRRFFQSATQSLQVPTALEKEGDFSDWPYPIYDPSTSGSVPVSPDNPAGRTPYPNNKISSTFNPISVNLLKYFPTANVSCQLPCPNFVGTTQNSIVTNNITARVDQVLTTRDQLSGTLIWSHDTEPQPSLLPASGNTIFDRDLLAGLEWSHTFGPNTLNVVRFGANRRFFHEGADTSYGPDLASEAGLKNAVPPPQYAGIPLLVLNGGYSGPGSDNNGFHQPATVFQYVDNLVLSRGKHNLTVGADIRRSRLSNELGAGVDGYLRFTGAYTASDPSKSNLGQTGPTTGNSFADFLLGDPQNITPPQPFGTISAIVRKTDWNIFFQDDYHVTPRLTVNMGLRYEISGQWYSTNHSGTVFNPDTPGGGQVFASQSFVQSAVPNPIYFQCCAPKTLIPNDYRNLAPRLGFAWRPSVGNDRLVLRGGYGVFYDTSMEYYNSLAYNDNIFQSVSATVYPQASGLEAVSPLNLNSLWLPSHLSQPGTALPPPYLFSFGGGGLYWKNKTPRNQQWTFDVQYSVTPDFMLDVAYVGRRGSNEPSEWFFNGAVPPTVAGDPCNFLYDRSLATGSFASCLADPNFQPIQERVPYANFSAASVVRANIGWSNYNALQVRTEKRFSRGLQFLANYTWSKNLDVVSGTDEVGGMGGGEIDFQDPHNIGADYGISTLNIPQRLSLTYLYEVPVGNGKRWSLGKSNSILGGWKASGNVTFASGLPFTLFAYPRGTDQFGSFIPDRIRVNASQDPNKGFHQSLLEWFNTDVVSAPTAGTYGNLRRNTLRGTTQRVADVSFTKDFPISEAGPRFQYRLDIFNFLSSTHAVSKIPNNNMSGTPQNCTPGPSGTCAFGSLVPLNGLGSLNLWNPRRIQMALKFIW